MASEKFKVDGMHCSSCESVIERAVKEIEGIEHVKADYESSMVDVKFDIDVVSREDIAKAIESKGYVCSIFGQEARSSKGKLIGILLGVIGIIVAGYFILHLAEGISVPEISQNMGYGLLFVVGLLTGFHCVSMCGGFVVSYTAKNAQMGRKSHKSHLMYGLGKVISYTVIGAGFGLLGSMMLFTPLMRGLAGILAGLFLVVFGLNMLDLVPWFRKVRIRVPSSLSRFVGRESRNHGSPLVIGLLNGLMIACGPLQAIYIMAAGTGSAIEGAKILFVFALGTLPVMLGFGFFTSFISKRATRRILKASGIVVIVLGLMMMNRGLSLTGEGFDISSLVASASQGDKVTGNVVMDGDYQIIRMDVLSSGWSPDKFVLKKGVPVRWIIDGKEITGCNNAIQVPKLGLEFGIKPGEQVIEFTPKESGVISWSCWMGMIRGTFLVEDDIDLKDSAAVQRKLDSVPKQAGGSCGCGCGGRR